MANISKIKMPGGSVYDVVDESARSGLNDKAPLASPIFTGTPTAPTAPEGTNTTQIATTAFVKKAVESGVVVADALVFKGTIGSSGADVSALPSTHVVGWTYKVVTDGTYAGETCENGDLIICNTAGTSANDSHWSIVQGNTDGTVVGPNSASDMNVAVFNGATGKIIKDSGFTIGKSVPSDAKFTDTTYGEASTSNAGLMSAADKTKLNGISTMGAASSSAAGTSGLVPAPAAGKQEKFLRGDGTWVGVNFTMEDETLVIDFS